MTNTRTQGHGRVHWGAVTSFQTGLPLPWPASWSEAGSWALTPDQLSPPSPPRGSAFNLEAVSPPAQEPSCCQLRSPYPHPGGVRSLGISHSFPGQSDFFSGRCSAGGPGVVAGAGDLEVGGLALCQACAEHDAEPLYPSPHPRLPFPATLQAGLLSPRFTEPRLCLEMEGVWPRQLATEWLVWHGRVVPRAGVGLCCPHCGCSAEAAARSACERSSWVPGSRTASAPVPVAPPPMNPSNF